jgi:ubiquinone/menaquinone biosynthesis C-methylase UbiE
MRNLLNRRLLKSVVLLMAVATGAAIQNDAADVTRLVEVLGVHAGSVLADIGAGDGLLTIPVAREVGPSGHVYATDLGGAPLERLRKALAKADMPNIEVVEGRAAQTNLPAECCDGIFIRNVYHHFADPAAMNASLRQSLKPGGKLAILDFAPNGPEATAPADRAGGKTHGVTAGTVARELQQAGFELVTTEQRHNKTFLVVVRKPEK